MIPTGKGHYDAAIPAFKHSKVDRTNAIASIKSCRCGINKKSAATESCKPCLIYTTRCKRYKESRPCNALCQCVSCTNPQGQKLQHSKDEKRITRQHPLQVENQRANDLLKIEVRLCQKQSGPTLERSSPMNYAPLYWINPPIK